MNTKNNQKFQIFIIVILLLTFNGCSKLYIRESTDVIKEDIKHVSKKPLISNRNDFNLFKFKKFNLVNEKNYSKLILNSLPTFIEDQNNYDSIKDSLVSNGKKYNIDPLIIFALAIKESNFDSNYSKNGRIGLVPLDFDKTKFIADLYQIELTRKNQLRDIIKNIECSYVTLNFLQDLFKDDLRFALLAYKWEIDQISSLYESKSEIPKDYFEFIENINKLYKKLSEGAFQIEVDTDKNIKNEVVKAEIKKEEQKPFVLNYYKSGLSRSEKKKLSVFISRELENSKMNKDIRLDFIDEIIEKSLRYNYDPLFIFSLIKIESNFDPDAVSKTGKVGLFQIDSNDGQYLASLTGQKWTNKEELKNISYNIDFGLAVFSLANKVFENNHYYSIVGYNWGIKKLISTLQKQQKLTFEAEQYPRKIFNLYQKWLQDLEKLDLDREEEARAIQLEERMAFEAEQAKLKAEIERQKQEEKKKLAEELKREEIIQKLEFEKAEQAKLKAEVERQKQEEKEKLAEELKREEIIQKLEFEKTEQAKLRAEVERTRQEEDRKTPAENIAKTEQSDTKISITNDKLKFANINEKIKYLVCSKFENGNEIECSLIGEKIIFYANSYGTNPLLLTIIARNVSNFKKDLKIGNKVGLFQIPLSEVDYITKKAGVTWAGEAELKKIDYSIRLAGKYLYYLEMRYKGKIDYVIPAFLWNPDKFSDTVRSKKSIPNDINMKSSLILNEYKKFK